MSRPFNFYQGTGFPIGPNVPTNITDFFTGFFMPPEIALGPFNYFVSSRKVFWGIDFRGDVDAGLNQQANLQSTYRGFLTPLYKESGLLQLGFSGGVLFGQVDTVGIPISFSGDLITGRDDDCYSSIAFSSGEISGGIFDSPSITSVFSGGLTGTDIDYPVMTFSFRGGFTNGNDYNEGAISFELLSITFNQGASKLATGFETGANIDFYLSSISYKENFGPV